jgi:hypothetical protein
MNTPSHLMMRETILGSIDGCLPRPRINNASSLNSKNSYTNRPQDAREHHAQLSLGKILTLNLNFSKMLFLDNTELVHFHQLKHSQESHNHFRFRGGLFKQR